MPRRADRAPGSAILRVGVRARARLTGDAAISVACLVTDDNVCFLRECIDALGAQHRRAEEVLLLVTGTADFTAELVRRAATANRRVRVVERPGLSVNVARHEVVTAARGRYLLFQDTGDRLAPGALASLAAARGDVTVALLGGGSTADALAARLGDLLIRRKWLTRRLHLLDSDEPAADLVLAAADHGGLAIVDAAAAHGLERGKGLVFGGMRQVADDAEAFGSRTRDRLARLRDLDPAPLARHLVQHQLPAYLADAERCDDAGWTALAKLAGELLELADPASIPVEPRVATWLAAHDHREALTGFLLERWQREGDFPAAARDGHLVASFGAVDDVVPEDVRRVAEAESPLRLLARRALRRPGGGLDLEVGLAVPHVALGDAAVTARLDGQPIDVTVDRDPEVDLAIGDRYADTRIVQVRRVGSASDRIETPRTLDVDVTIAGVRRTARLRLDPAAPPADGIEGVVATDRRITGRVPGGDDLELDLTADPWGVGERPVPPGPRRWRTPLGPEEAARAPRVLATKHHRIRLRSAPDGATVLDPGPPLADDEVGPRSQELLRQDYVARAGDPGTPPVDPGVVLFNSYLGQGGDSPAAIHAALRRLRPELRTLWLVADSSIQVPDGAEPVQLRSRAWYDALTSAGHIVTNIDLEPWFVKRPGQRVLQTYHGHPSKLMGLSAWQAKGYPPSRIDEMLRRTRDTWDALVSPSAEGEQLYREQFAYDGQVITTGYPRNDALVAPDREQRRQETRERLGIADGQRAVLYAPTWRDDLASNHRVAPMDALFDVEAAADQLGESWVVLLRGHRFHRQRPAGDGARVVDVTEHPRIEGLMLASDAAVLDYSSLRFDYALTDRPMLFLVPDRERYIGAVRGFLHDYGPTAPGPLLDTTEQVTAALDRLDETAEVHATARAAFRKRFWALQDDNSASRVVEAFWSMPESR